MRSTFYGRVMVGRYFNNNYQRIVFLINLYSFLFLIGVDIQKYNLHKLILKLFIECYT